MNRYVIGIAVFVLGCGAYIYLRDSRPVPAQETNARLPPPTHSPTVNQSSDLSSAGDSPSAAELQRNDARPNNDSPSPEISASSVPRDLQAALRESFDHYEALLAGPAVMPEWWANRNVQGDLSVIESSAYVTRTHCVETLCAVDIEHKAMDGDNQRTFDVAVLNLPTLQTGALIRRFEGDPRRMRIYVHNVSMQSVPIDMSYQTAADILKREQRMQSAAPPDR